MTASRIFNSVYLAYEINAWSILVAWLRIGGLIGNINYLWYLSSNYLHISYVNISFRFSSIYLLDLNSTVIWKAPRALKGVLSKEKSFVHLKAFLAKVSQADNSAASVFASCHFRLFLVPALKLKWIKFKGIGLRGGYLPSSHHS